MYLVIHSDPVGLDLRFIWPLFPAVASAHGCKPVYLWLTEGESSAEAVLNETFIYLKDASNS